MRHQRLLPVPGSDVGLLSINQVTGCAMLVNRALLQAALPLPGSALMHDWWCALLAAGGGRQFVDQALVLYRQHGANQLGADVDIGELLAICVSENDRRLAPYDQRLKRPRLVPFMARLALKFVGPKKKAAA